MRSRAMVGVVIGAALLSLVPGSWVPIISSACLPNQAAKLAELKVQLGDTMGEALGCAQSDTLDGDVVQQTTKGFAYVHGVSGPPSFTNGREFWALMPDGVEYWTGSLHVGIDPPSMVPGRVAPPPNLSMATAETYPTVDPVVLMGAPDSVDGSLVVQREGKLYQISLEPGEPGMALTVGQTLFIRSPGAFGSNGAELIALETGSGYRRVAVIHPL